MKIIYSITIFFLIFSTAVQAKENQINKSLIILGGGGEPKGDDTIFDRSLEDLGRVYQLPIWKDKFLSFDSGHPVTEKIIQDKFSNPQNTPFSTLNFYYEIDKIKKLMTDKKTKQVMVYIDSHGELKGKDELSHHIHTIDSQETVGLDKLQELSILAEKNGILLAIIDQSCHSGNTITLANKFTCVVSATSPDLYSYGSQESFTEEFLKRLKPGANLEDAFLKARLDSSDAGFPMISTKESESIKKSFYEKLVPYIYKNEHFDEFITKEVNSSNSCIRKENYDELLNMISQVEKANSHLILSHMKNLLSQYHQVLDDYIKNEEILNGEEFKKEIMLSSSDGKYKDSVSLRKFITSDYDEAISEQEKLLKTKLSPDDREFQMAILDFFKIAKSEQEKIRKEHPEYQRAIKDNHDFHEKIESLSGLVANESKRVYQELYSAEMTARKKKESNPCRDFVL